MAYKVFASYAVRDRTKRMEKIMERFKEALRTKIGAREKNEIEDIIFFDFKSIKAGDEWTSVMADAVGEAEMLVCLVSPTYLNSPWCGRELEAFHQRLSQWKAGAGGKKGARFVFPVLWEPSKRRALPAKLSAQQFCAHGWPKDYEGGLRHLADMNKYRDHVTAFLEHFAESVDQALAAGTALPPMAVDFKTITNAFEETPPALPYDLAFWPAVAGGGDWVPTAGGRSIATEVAAAAGLMRVFVHPFQAETNLAAQMVQFWKDRQILLVVADAQTPPGPELAALNALSPPLSLALLLVDAQTAPGQPPRTVADWIGALPEGSFHCAAQRLHAASCLPANVIAEIDRIATRVRLALINGDDATPAENAALAKEAESRGIPTTAKASLTGATPAA